jgi:hypothetical protein
VQVSLKSDVSAVLAILGKKSEALRNLRPALQDIAAEIDRQTAQNLQDSRRSDGVPFADLADSTMVGRLRQRKSTWRKITKGAKPRQRKQREALRAGNFTQWTQIRSELRGRVDAALDAANFKPLINTGRGRNSARAKVVGQDTIKWSVVSYMVPHIGGGKNNRPPMRNFSVFQKPIGSADYELQPQISGYIRTRLIRHIAEAK